MEIMNIAISFSWPAGAWINTAWMFLAEVLAEKWYYVLADKEYDSIIKWWNNVFTLYISDKKEFISKKIDYFFAYDDYAVEKNSKIYHIINAIKIDKTACKYQNVFSVGSAFKILWLDKKTWDDKLAKTFKWDVLTINQTDFDAWYDKQQNMSELVTIDFNTSLWAPKKLMFGNEILATWAAASWLQFYSAYPMTPASSIIDVIIKNKDIIFFQWEDEISVSMSMLGAHFAGKRAMCGTSGWGFALMTESIAFAHQAELWGLYILSQRAGPSTWTPTYSEQADLNFALNASFGDTFPIVLSPSDYQNWYNLIGKALNFADIYQHPVIVIVDKQFSESFVAIDPSTLKSEAINKWKRIDSVSEDTFKRYSFQDDWISPMSIPWIENWEFIATSYEHDEYWATSEDLQMKKTMTEKRHQKLQTFASIEFNKDFYWYEIINPKAKKFFVTFGFSKYVLDNFIVKNSDYWLIIVTMIQPLDPRLKDFFVDNFDKVDEFIFVEQNYSWQLETHIRNKFWFVTKERNAKIKSMRKYELYPFFEEEFTTL